MIKVNVFEVKAKLSEYLDRAASGESILICRHNKPVAELRAVDAARTEPRLIGPLPGRPTFEVPASFFEPLTEEELNQWEGVPTNDPLSLSTRGRPSANASRVAETKPRYGKRTRGRGGRRQ